MRIKFRYLILILILPCLGNANDNDALFLYNNGDYFSAAPELKKLAGEKNKVALYYLGMMAINGYAEQKNLSAGIKLITQSAEKDYLPAQLFLGKYYFQKLNDPQNAFYWFDKASKLNDVSAQMYCAAASLSGYGVKKDTEAARRYIILAAKNGNPVAQYHLAMLFLDSKNLKNKQLGLLWLIKSARQNYSQAQYQLGTLYFSGQAVEKNLDEGLKWLEAAMKNNNEDAAYLLANYYKGLPDRISQQRAIDIYKQYAQQNYLLAQYHLGLLYLTIPEKQHDGFLWILNAAQKGSIDASMQLAKMFSEGTTIPKNAELAEQWQLIAENQSKLKTKNIDGPKQQMLIWLSGTNKPDQTLNNYRVAGILTDWKNNKIKDDGSYNLSPQLTPITRENIFNSQFEMTDPNHLAISEFIDTIGALKYKAKQHELTIPTYDLGINDYKALFPLLREADFGYAPSQLKVGLMYQYGIGVKKNLSQAIQYYHKAAQQRYANAEYMLGLLYLYGQGVTENAQIAMAWINSSAYKGNIYAQYLLGALYENGFGKENERNYVARDITRAKIMYGFAAYSGYAKAQYNLADLYASGLIDRGQTLKTQHQTRQLMMELYKNAAKNGIDAAKLDLAYYYANKNVDPQKQNWAFNVAVTEAKKNNSYAFLLLGLMYDRGIGTEINQKQAIQWYTKALDDNNPIAQFILGTYYSTGTGVNKDLQKAEELLTKSADQNFSFANYNLAMIKAQLNPNADVNGLLQQASDQGYEKASLLLADRYARNENDSKELTLAANIYQRLAKMGYAQAQLRLGFMYENGIYYPQNFQQAKTWYQEAAKQKNQLGQYLLGNMYQVGKLGSPEIAIAKSWYQQATMLHYHPAKNALGFIDESIDHNYSDALDNYHSAAVANVPQAQFNLGLMYEYGKGIEVDYRKAFNLYLPAAEQGLAAAQYALGNLYHFGLGVKADPEKAKEWYRKAAAQNFELAIHQLGLLTKPKNLVENPTGKPEP